MYLSSKHQSRGDLGGMRNPNRVLSMYLPLCICNYPFYSAYKSLNHRVNFGRLSFVLISRGIQDLQNCLDATKTIHAPYCQGNVAVFGENVGQQWIAMNLCALIYRKIRRIIFVDDMIQIMIVGNKLYSSLSLLKRQSMLKLTELPEVFSKA